uniref:DUF3102 domain-containing protein n=1 Tax=uncultured Oscillibacter sp. TaxID=876091 RepID=UPI00272C16B7
MNNSDFEGKCLSEQFGVGGPPEVKEEAPPPVRTVEVVTLEIRTLQRQAQQVVLGYAIEIGRRLEEVKAMLPHGRWGDYLKNEVAYSQSTAQNFMRIFREYGASQQSLFGGVANSQALGNLTYTKALQLLAIPDAEDRERFAIENDVEHMSVRELNEALKARDEAEEKAAAAQDEAGRLEKRVLHLQEEIAGQAQVYEAKLTSAGVEAEQARAAAKAAQDALDKQRDKAQRLQDALSEANTSAQAAEEEHARLLQELEELRSRPVDVAVEVDEKAVEAAREAAVAEMTEKVNKAKAAAKKAKSDRQAAEDALADVQRQLDELKAKEPQVRELTQDEIQTMTAEAVSKARAEDLERVKALEKQLASADGDVAAFRVHYEAWQDHYNKMSGYL